MDVDDHYFIIQKIDFPLVFITSICVCALATDVLLQMYKEVGL